MYRAAYSLIIILSLLAAANHAPAVSRTELYDGRTALISTSNGRSNNDLAVIFTAELLIGGILLTAGSAYVLRRKRR